MVILARNYSVNMKVACGALRITNNIVTVKLARKKVIISVKLARNYSILKCLIKLVSKY